MATPYFPPITNESLAPLRALRQLMAADPGLLANPACPYNRDQKEFISELMGSKTSGVPEFDIDLVQIGQLDDPAVLQEQFEAMYRTLMGYQKAINTSESKDQVAWAKAAIGLLDRIVGLRERVHNVKSFVTFQKAIIELLDTVMEPHQRTAFVEKLGAYLEKPEKKDA